MSISINEAHLDSDESLRKQPRADEARAETHGVVAGSPLPSEIGGLIRRIEPEALRALVAPVFKELARIMDYLRLIEDGLSADESLQKTGILFRLVHERTLTLLQQLEAGTLCAARFDAGVQKVLDGMGFAIRHELRRVFRDEVPELNGSERKQLSRAELVRAQGLLHNCFQQSTITLAQAFDPALDGAQLFEDYRVKVRQSLILYGELLSLLRKVREARMSAGVPLEDSLATQLKHFREETMHFLMYRDWAEFERFVGEVLGTYDEPVEFARVLHRFASYLGTLLQHVGMRDVLKSRPLADELE
jgi:hypothetical protein